MLQTPSGEWSINVILVGGKEHRSGVSVAGVQITDNKTTFLDFENQELEHPFFFTRVDSDRKGLT